RWIGVRSRRGARPAPGRSWMSAGSRAPALARPRGACGVEVRAVDRGAGVAGADRLGVAHRVRTVGVVVALERRTDVGRGERDRRAAGALVDRDEDAIGSARDARLI